MPDVSADTVIDPIVSGLDSIRSSDLRGLADEAEGLLNDIPNEIQTEIDNAVNSITTEANSVQADLQQQIEDIRSDANEFAYHDFNIAEQKENIAQAFSDADPYEEMKTTASVALAGYVIAMGALIAIATVVGALLYRSDTDPADRGWPSTCSARVILGSVGMLVIVTTLLQLLVAILFIFAAVTGKMCDSLDGDEVYAKVRHTKQGQKQVTTTARPSPSMAALAPARAPAPTSPSLPSSRMVLWFSCASAVGRDRLIRGSWILEALSESPISSAPCSRATALSVCTQVFRRSARSGEPGCERTSWEASV